MADKTTPQQILEMSRAFQRSRLLLSAHELDVFTVIHDEWRTSAEVAEAIEADPRATDRLLNALVALGLLAKRGGRFANTPETARFLVRGQPDYLGNLQHTVNMWDSWSNMTRAVREGGSPHRARIDDRGSEWYRPFIQAMHWRGRLHGAEIVSLIDLEGVSRVLDIGGGSGAFSMAFVRAGAGSAVVFDLPGVIPITKNYIDTEGFRSSITTVEGDYHYDPLPSGFDLAFLSAVIHSNGPEENRRLVRKAASSLDPGGRVVIVDWLMSDDRTEPAAGALFAMNMLVSTGAGDTYTETEVREWMAEAGLTAIARMETPGGNSVMIGRLPR